MFIIGFLVIATATILTTYALCKVSSESEKILEELRLRDTSWELYNERGKRRDID